MATPTIPIQVPAAPQQSDAPSPDSMSDDSSATKVTVNLQRALSHLNAAVRTLFDGLAIPRSATIPHQDGQSMADHVQAIGQVMSEHGGLTNSLMTATHSLHDADGGSTTGHPSSKLLEAIIPQDSADAKAAIQALRSLVNKIASLLGEDDPTVRSAKSQIAIISKNNLAGASAFDAGVLLLNIPTPLIQKLARNHSHVKHGGQVNPLLTAPQQ